MAHQRSPHSSGNGEINYSQMKLTVNLELLFILDFSNAIEKYLPRNPKLETL